MPRWYDFLPLIHKHVIMKKDKPASKKKKPVDKEDIENAWNIGNYGSRPDSEKALTKKEKPSKK